MVFFESFPGEFRFNFFTKSDAIQKEIDEKKERDLFKIHRLRLCCKAFGYSEYFLFKEVKPV
jgi:hypothetical protein